MEASWRSCPDTPRHDDDGYLLSLGFLSNTDLVEARPRRREDIDRRNGAAEDREDVGYYPRYTYKC